MFSFHADDGRILTPPKELEPLLKGAYPTFFKMLGHIRFFYVADEIWDGRESLLFSSEGKPLAGIALADGAFHLYIAGEEIRITDESMLDAVFDALKKNATANQRRPADQLDVNLDEYPNGIRCDLCLIYQGNNEDNDYAGNRKFPVMDHNCYYGVQEGWGTCEFSTHTCAGKEGCYTKTYACLEKKGFKNCLACGEYRTCGDCGVGHNPGECNLGITAEEVTSLILPYCDVERLDWLRENA